jgi:double-stranded uracil-DNA glycosylase
MILPDYLCENLNIVFCGTAAGDRSAARGHYYAGFGNNFWPVLYRTRLTPALLGPEHDATLNKYRIGFTDLVKHHSGNDDELQPEMFAVSDFKKKILAHMPRVVAFTSKRGAAVFFNVKSTNMIPLGLHKETIGPTSVFVLPSTSGSARRYWDEKPWHELAEYVRSYRRS